MNGASREGTQWTSIILAITIPIVIVFFIWRFYPIDSGPQAICGKLIPQEAGFSAKYSTDAKGVTSVEIAGVNKINNPTLVAAYDAFILCLQQQKVRVDILRGNGSGEVEIPGPDTVYEIAKRWEVADGLQLNIRGIPHENRLENIAFGPGSGKKYEVVAAWCGPKGAGACVECQPQVPNKDTKTVNISLRPNAPLVLAKRDGTWQKPKGNIPAPMVDDEGVSTYYQCVPPSE